MAIWTEEVSNEGHVYAALEDDLADFTFWLAFEDRSKEPFPDAVEELAMEDGQMEDDAPAKVGPITG